MIELEALDNLLDKVIMQTQVTKPFTYDLLNKLTKESISTDLDKCVKQSILEC